MNNGVDVVRDFPFARLLIRVIRHQEGDSAKGGSSYNPVTGFKGV